MSDLLAVQRPASYQLPCLLTSNRAAIVMCRHLKSNWILSLLWNIHVTSQWQSYSIV